jgi:1,4-alpha-glucan branching enzyme
VEDLNRLYRTQPGLHELDCTPAGFEWIDCTDAGSSILSFLRKGQSPRDSVLVICNFTPVPRTDYQVGVPHDGFWQEILNSDAEPYGGSGQGNLGGAEATATPFHGRPFSLQLALPPLAILFLKASPLTLHGESTELPT